MSTAIEQLEHAMHECRKCGDAQMAACADFAEGVLSSARFETDDAAVHLRAVEVAIEALVPAAQHLLATTRAICDAERGTKRERDYLVVATYTDNDQRFATTVTATSPDEAERKAAEHADSRILVAAVLCDGVIVG